MIDRRTSPASPAAAPSRPSGAECRRRAGPELLRPLAEYERRSGEAGDAVDNEALERMLSRLKLTAIRDQLDSLLDEAARRS